MASNISFVKVEDDAGIKNVNILAESIWFEYFPSIISVAQIEYMLDKFLSEQAIKEQIAKGEHYYIVKRDRELVGFLAINVTVESNKRKLYLSKLYLEKIYRGCGIASEMIKFIKDFAKEKKCTSIFLHVNKYNSSTINIYNHWGFKKIEDQKRDIGKGYIMDDYVMSLELE